MCAETKLDIQMQGPKQVCVGSVCIHYQINITELIQPEIVDGSGDCRKIVGLESVITQRYCCAQTRQNPAIRHTFTATQLRDTQSHV